MAFIYDLTDTWNAGGTTFNAIKMNVTDSASAAASRLISLQVGGAERFGVRKDGQGYFAGDVGIGTSSPGAKLHVVGNTYVQSGTVFTDTLAAFSASLTLNAGNFLAALTGGTERMRITAAGNVGIGTTSPSYRLQIAAPGGAQSIFLAGQTGVSNGYTISSNGSALTHQWYNTGTEAMRLDSSGNLLVGTATTAYGTAGRGLIEVNGSSSALIAIKTGDTARGYFAASSSVTELSAVGASQPLLFTTNSAERMRIDSSGNVLVGTTSNAEGARLKVDNGYVFIKESGGADVYLRSAYAGSAAAIQVASSSPLAFATANAERMRIDTNGNLLVGTTSGALFARILAESASVGGNFASNNTAGSGTRYHCVFYENGTERGSITSNGSSTSYNTSSDARLKHDIVDAPDAADLIDAIKVRSFKWNADNSEQRYGMVAQELLEVAPEAVSVPADEDQMMGVDYSKLVPMLIKEVQSLRARVAQLEGN